jgi:ferredoxin-NADP reductase/nitrite reductase/ring-hydroxylating ferredoxin subunit
MVSRGIVELKSDINTICSLQSLINTMAKEGHQKVANKNDLPEGGLFKVEPQDRHIVLSMVNGKVYAMDAVCSHEGGPLEEGSLDGYNLTCPWHYAIFDVRNAKVSDQTVWATDLDSYQVEVDEESGDIYVNLEAGEKGKDKISTQPSAKEEVPETTQQLQEQRRKQDDSGKPSHFNLRLLEKQKVDGTDIMSFKFAKLDEEGQQQQQGQNRKKQLEYSAGQFAFFDIGGVYNDPEGPIRHFTITSSPTEDFIMISTRIRDTPYKKRLSSLEENTTIVKVRGPEGKFTLHEDHSKPAVFLSGGIGVTPFRSMIKYATDKQLPVKIIMFDSNRNENNILYKKEFDECANMNKNLKVVYSVTEEEGGEEQPAQNSSPSIAWNGERGRIDKAMITRYLSDKDIKDSIFYICGPPGMVKAMQNLIQNELQIQKENIKIEEFTGY